MKSLPLIEVLESRIAPAAVYFVQNNALAVHKAGGGDAQDSPEETLAAANAHSDAAVLLKTGDTLVFDANNNNRFDAGDKVLARISGGQAMLFFTNGAGPTAGGFDKNEITGAAVSNGFRGAFYTDINGSVATALDATGNVTLTGGVLALQHSSIASLSVAGQINGSVLAGGGIANVHVGGKLFNTGAQYGVNGHVATGTAAADAPAPSFNNGANTNTVAFTQTPGENGGNIVKIVLPFGAQEIHAGDGAAGAAGAGGKGGSVLAVQSVASTARMSIVAGNGGAGTGAGAGGAGGIIAGCVVTEHAAPTDALLFQAGNGGASSAGDGGAGGVVFGLRATVLDPATSLSVLAGNGGAGGGSGDGGAGGSLLSVVTHTSTLSGALNVVAGNGGASGTAGGSGGNGGLASGIVVNTIGAASTGIVNVAGGQGGAGFSHAGAGGSLAGIQTALSPVVNSVNIFAGGGGSGYTSATGHLGGAGGSVVHVKVNAASVGGDVNISAAFAGQSVGADGQNGGVAADVRVKTSGVVGGTVSVIGGGGGFVLGAGNGGSGGAVVGVSYTNLASVDAAEIRSGSGGFVLDQTGPSPILAQGNGGRGGALAGIVINSYAAITDRTTISSGAGGSVSGVQAGDTGNGGSGGDVSGVVIRDFASSATGSAFSIYAGGGKSAAGSGTRGGDTGSVKNITLLGPSTHFEVGGGDLSLQAGNGGAGTSAVGGNGGIIANVHGTVGVLDILGNKGGSSADGHGGNGSSIVGVNVRTGAGAGHFIHMIAAGGGGNGGTSPGFAGNGGSVIGVRTNGDIGDFTKTFGLAEDSGAQGGISAGLAGVGGVGVGVNGSIVNISAARIATMIAGRPDPDGITAQNAVARIAGIHARVIGADTGIAGDHQEPGGRPGSTFDFNEGGSNNTFEPSSSNPIADGDTAIDGLVIVRAGRFAGPHPAPLKLIEIPALVFG